jgi:hypothetical protein
MKHDKSIPDDQLPLLNKMIAILDEIDPIRIIHQATRAGFPLSSVQGEYDPEARSILHRLPEWKDPENLAEIVREEFDYCFGGMYIADTIIRKLTAEFWNAYCDHINAPQLRVACEIELPEGPEPICIEID